MFVSDHFTDYFVHKLYNDAIFMDFRTYECYVVSSSLKDDF